MDACPKCPVGQYTDKLNLNSSCATCPRDAIAPTEGLSACGECPSDKFSNDGISCDSCGAGMFTHVSVSRTECLNCVQGTYQDVGSRDRCFNCPIGWYQKDEKKPFCLPCIPGEYQNIPGQPSCKQCLINTVSEYVNSTNCADCPIRSSSGTGSASCSPCAAGTFGEGCKNCPLGFARKGNDNNKDATQC